MNLMMLLEMAAGAYGDRVAFQNGADQLTYQQLFDAAGALAADLSDGRTKHLAMLDESSLALPIASGLPGRAYPSRRSTTGWS